MLLGGSIQSENFTKYSEYFQRNDERWYQSVKEVAAFVSEKSIVFPACKDTLAFLQTAPVAVASNER